MNNKTIYIGIDPDLRRLNCALLLSDPVTKKNIPLAVFKRKNTSKDTKDKAVVGAVKAAILLASDVVDYFIAFPEVQQCQIVLIVESQSMQHIKHLKHDQDPDDILRVGQTAGILMGVFGDISDTIHLIQPATWKKQMKKHIHHPRILNRLSLPYKKLTSIVYPEIYKTLGQYSGDKVNPGDFEDINDSIGLALYGAEHGL